MTKIKERAALFKMEKSGSILLATMDILAETGVAKSAEDGSAAQPQEEAISCHPGEDQPAQKTEENGVGKQAKRKRKRRNEVRAPRREPDPSKVASLEEEITRLRKTVNEPGRLSERYLAVVKIQELGGELDREFSGRVEKRDNGAGSAKE